MARRCACVEAALRRRYSALPPCEEAAEASVCSKLLFDDNEVEVQTRSDIRGLTLLRPLFQNTHVRSLNAQSRTQSLHWLYVGAKTRSLWVSALRNFHCSTVGSSSEKSVDNAALGVGQERNSLSCLRSGCARTELIVQDLVAIFVFWCTPPGDPASHR